MAKDAFAQGKLAFEHNLAMSSCDYPVGSSLRAEWMAGWTEASNARSRAGGSSPNAAQGRPDERKGVEQRA